MDIKEILNSPLDKFLIPVYKIYLHVKPPPSTKWIISHIDKVHACIENRVWLDYFLNIPSSRLDWMHPQHPWVEKYLTVNITQYRNPQINFKSGIHRQVPELKSHLGMIYPTCISPLQFKLFPRLLLLYRHHYEYSMQLLSNIMPTPLKKNLKLFFYFSIITGDTIRHNIAQMTSIIQSLFLAFISPQSNNSKW